MAIPLGKIRWPRWSQPALLAPGQSFQVIAEGPMEQGAQFWLESGDSRFPLTVAGQSAAAGLVPYLPHA